MIGRVGVGVVFTGAVAPSPCGVPAMVFTRATALLNEVKYACICEAAEAVLVKAFVAFVINWPPLTGLREAFDITTARAFAA